MTVVHKAMNIDLKNIIKGMEIEIKGYGWRGVTKVEPFNPYDALLTDDGEIVSAKHIILYWVSFVENGRVVTGEYKKNGQSGGSSKERLIPEDGDIIDIRVNHDI